MSHGTCVLSRDSNTSMTNSSVEPRIATASHSHEHEAAVASASSRRRRGWHVYSEKNKARRRRGWHVWSSLSQKSNCSKAAPVTLDHDGLWGLDRIESRAAKGWKDGKYHPHLNGSGVHVYVLDSGIRTTHKEFEGRAIPTIETHEGRLRYCDRSDDTPCAMDHYGHGTHCAGTIGGKSVGVARGVTLHAVKVLDDQGRSSTTKILLAMDWMLVNAEKHSIMSMGFASEGRSEAMRVSLQKLEAAKVVSIVAAGDGRSRACSYSPAYLTEAIAVGAIGSDGIGMARHYSNFGTCVDIWAPGGFGCSTRSRRKKVCAKKQGIGIYSATAKSNHAYENHWGTAMAAAHVSGVAATMLQVDADLALSGEMLKALQAFGTKKILEKTRRGSPNLLLHTDCFSKEDFPSKGADETNKSPPRTLPVKPKPTRRRGKGAAEKSGEKSSRRRSRSSSKSRSRGRRRRRRSRIEAKSIGITTSPPSVRSFDVGIDDSNRRRHISLS